jgi:hypothetical protein
MTALTNQPKTLLACFVAAATLVVGAGSSRAADPITVNDGDSEKLASTLIADIKAAKVRPLNGHLKVDSVLCNPDTSHCQLVVNGKKLPLITGTFGDAWAEVLEEIGATAGPAAGGNNIDCVVIGPPKCTIEQDLKAALAGGACGDDVKIRTKCVPDLTCEFPPGVIREHAVGACTRGCEAAVDCEGDGHGKALCCPLGGAPGLHVNQCFAFSPNGCPAFP